MAANLSDLKESLGEDQLEQVQLCMDGGSVVRVQGSILQNLEDSLESIPVRWVSLMLSLVG